MKYYFVDDASSTMSNMDVKPFDTEKEAVIMADDIWNHLTDREKKSRDAFYVAVGNPTKEEVESGFLPAAGVDIVKKYK